MVEITCKYVNGFDTKECCESCHDDYETYGYDLCFIEIKSKEYSVCCKCAIFIEEKF